MRFLRPMIWCGRGPERELLERSREVREMALKRCKGMGFEKLLEERVRAVREESAPSSEGM